MGYERTKDLDCYEEGVIMKKGEKRWGLTQEKRRKKMGFRQTKYLTKKKCLPLSESIHNHCNRDRLSLPVFSELYRQRRLKSPQCGLWSVDARRLN